MLSRRIVIQVQGKTEEALGWAEISAVSHLGGGMTSGSATAADGSWSIEIEEAPKDVLRPEPDEFR